MKIRNKTCYILLVTIVFQVGLKAQNRVMYESSNNTNIKNQDKETVVNQEMIKRFNSCEISSNYLSWSDLVTGFDKQSLMNLYVAYLNADFVTETMKDIKLALENNEEHLNNSNISEHELAWYNQVKREINNKLMISEMTALK